MEIWSMGTIFGSKVDAIFAGGITCLEPEGQRTGIYKRRVAAAARVALHGIVGDEQGDPRMHGGPEKAVHQYAAENYARLASGFPACVTALVPGSLGENISARHLTELNVHIGDIFRIGSTIMQVSQTRSPCWKINHRFSAELLSMHMVKLRATGWYYRVIQPGFIQPGDDISLLERQTERFSIDEFWKVQLTHRPDIDSLLEISAIPGLAEEWRSRLTERVKWLRRQT
jgi:MOSC domain-containing protein YiiM